MEGGTGEGELREGGRKGLRMRLMVGDLVLNWPWVDIVGESCTEV